MVKHQTLEHRVRKMASIGAPSDYNRMKEVKAFDESKTGVKGLSDSGITTIPKFFVHPPETLSSLKSSSKSSGIPVIDLSNTYQSQEQRQKIVAQIRDAAREWGFFQVINHGIPVSDLNKTLDALRSFHEQPQEVKAMHYVREEKRGFMYASNNDLYRSKAASWHDYMHVWMAPETVANVEQVPAEYRQEVVEWDRHATAVAEKLAGLLSEGLGLEARKMKEMGLLVTKAVAGVYYPYCPEPDLTLGLSHHTDPGVLTVLLQNQVTGLQVKHGGEWVDVKPLPGALIINIGDALQIISNGEYRSVEHRVLANSRQQPRMSMVEFFNFDTRNESHCYGPIPELLSPEKPARYRNFTVKEFNENYFTKELHSKSLVEKFLL